MQQDLTQNQYFTSANFDQLPKLKLLNKNYEKEIQLFTSYLISAKHYEKNHLSLIQKAGIYPQFTDGENKSQKS